MGFVTAANFANAATTKITKLATPTGLEIPIFEWDVVPEATKYIVVISKNRYEDGFNYDTGKCNDICSTTTINVNVLDYLNVPKTKIGAGYIPLDPTKKYISIMAIKDRLTYSEWGRWTIERNSNSGLMTAKKIDLTKLIIPTVVPTDLKQAIYSNSDYCKNDPNWCLSPTWELLGIIGASSVPFSLITGRYAIDTFKRDVTKTGIQIQANIYNRGYADAIIDIYDHEKNWIGFVNIPGHRPETTVLNNMYDTFSTGIESWVDDFSAFDPRGATASKKQDVNFSIPVGGYAVMSKSSLTAITNTSVNTILEAAGAKTYINRKGSQARRKMILLFTEEIAKSSVKGTLNKLKIAISEDKKLNAFNIALDMGGETAVVIAKVFLTEGNKRNELIRIFGEMGITKKVYNKIFPKLVTKIIAKNSIPGLGASELAAVNLGLNGQWMDIARDNDNKSVIFQ